MNYKLIESNYYFFPAIIISTIIYNYFTPAVSKDWSPRNELY